MTHTKGIVNHIIGDGNTVNNNVVFNNNNVNLTVNIQSFDEFSPEGIDMKTFLRLMREGGTNVILKCLEDQQFNIKHPDKMNVFVSNLKDRIARVYDGSRWMARKGDDVANKVFQIYTDMIGECVEEFLEKVTTSPASEKSLHRWNRHMDAEEFENHAKGEILMQLYNLRDIVKSVHSVKQRM